MMAIHIGGQTFELEGVLYARMPSCSLRKAGGKPITGDDLDRLSDDDSARLLDLIAQHIAAVAFLAGIDRPHLPRPASRHNADRGAQ